MSYSVPLHVVAAIYKEIWLEACENEIEKKLQVFTFNPFIYRYVSNVYPDHAILMTRLRCVSRAVQGAR